LPIGDLLKDKEAEAQVLRMLEGRARVPHVNVAAAMFSDELRQSQS
jgi:hypothetical protein